MHAYGVAWTTVTQSVNHPWRRRAERDARHFLSPAVRNLARELGIDPSSLPGRGTGGRVTDADVRAAGLAGDGARVSARDEVVPFDNVRRRTASSLLASKGTIPHALAVVAADYGAIDAARRGSGLTALPFVARAVIDALREFPLMNATTEADGSSVVAHRSVHLGIAVDLDFQGLVVPVVHGADGLRLRALAAAIRDLAGRARARRLTPDDLAGGTFTITNPGASGTWVSFPVINRPQVGILSTDGVSKQVVAARDDQLRVASVGHLCCAFDHRALDGAYAGAFVRRVQEIVETRDWSKEL
jgi:2-oxoglutarate dehydrogenase E2 component (dihydrolipoamide succinyltransferase)